MSRLASVVAVATFIVITLFGTALATGVTRSEPRPVHAEAPGTVPSGTSGINAAMSTGTQSGQITGRVTSASTGAPLASIEVDVGQVSGGVNDDTTTNANGEYTISRLPTGSYVVEFVRGNQNYLTQSENGVSVTAGSTTSIDAAMAPGGQITGRVTAASTGAPLANVAIDAKGTTVEALGGAITNANGEYTISGLLTGSYDVAFSPDEVLRAHGGNYSPQYYNGKSSSSEAEAVPVVAGGPPTSGIDAAMPPDGQITGRVTAASGGDSLVNIEVCARNPSYPLPPRIGEFGDGTCVTTNDRGEYTIVDLPIGSYDVEFSPGREGGDYLPQSDNGVSVTAGSTTSGIDAVMLPGTPIDLSPVKVHVQRKLNVLENVHISFHPTGRLPEGGYYYAVIVLKPYRHYTKKHPPPCATSSDMEETDYGYPHPGRLVRLALTPATSTVGHWCRGGAYTGGVYAVPHAPPCESTYPCRSEPDERSPCFGPGKRVCGVVKPPKRYAYPEGLPQPIAHGARIVGHFSVAF
jgi:5-hydroxyisourate hydrolase-like protein (transthyretin family)